jgi:predicted PurR-regulated permease PerM
MKLPETPKTIDEISELRSAHPLETAEIPKAIEPLNIRSISLAGIFLLSVFFALKVASSFFIPVVIALLLNFLFASTIRLLQRFWVPPALGAALVIACLVGGIGFGIYKFASPARDWMVKLPETARHVERKLKDVRESVREVTKASQEVDRLTKLETGEKTQSVEVRKPSFSETLLAPTQDFIVGSGTVLILLYFLLASGDLFLRKLVNVLPRFSEKKIAVGIARQIEYDVSLYLFSISAINALFGSSIAIAMYFLGMPNPLLWGAMAGLLHFIPFLGAIVGISIVTLVAAITFDGIEAILLVPAAYFGLNLLEEYVVLPLVVGRRLMLNPVVVLVWIFFWGWLWSVPGALMAVPLLAILKIVCDHVQPLAGLGEFIGR